MLRVTVVLPDDRKGDIEVEPEALISEVKSAIVNDLDLGEPNEYILAIADKEEAASVGNMKLQDGDFLILIKSSRTKPPVAKIDKSSFGKD